MIALALTLGVVCVAPIDRIVPPVQAQGTICFSENFNSGDTPYGFPFAYDPGAGTQWFREKLATGGYNGTGGEHIVFVSGQSQYDSGYAMTTGSCTFADGSSLFMRFRVKWDSNYVWNGAGSMQDKMIIFKGDNDHDSRIIFMNEKDNASTPCTIPGTNRGFISLKKNIGGPGATDNCTAYYEVFNNTWYEVQFEVDTDPSPGGGCLRVWVNNNTQGSPTREKCGLTLHAVASGDGMWSQIDLGGFMSEAPTVTAGKVWDDIVIATGFDNTWYQGGGSPPPTLPKMLLLGVGAY